MYNVYVVLYNVYVVLYTPFTHFSPHLAPGQPDWLYDNER